MDPLRTLETRIARLTLLALAVFAPVETCATWQMLGGARGLIHPSYIVTLTGMVLMFVGARRSLRARPRRAPELLCISHAWIVAYGLRGAFWRMNAVGAGLDLHFGFAELWATVAAASIGVLGFAASLILTLRALPVPTANPGLRRVETRLALFSLVALGVFVPIETVATWQMGGGAEAFVSPNFMHKIAGMVLVVVGARHSLSARPHRAPGPMCAAQAWWAATGWSATVGRYVEVSEGGGLHWGSAELWAVAAGTLIVITTFSVSFYLTYCASPVTEFSDVDK